MFDILASSDFFDFFDGSPVEFARQTGAEVVALCNTHMVPLIVVVQQQSQWLLQGSAARVYERATRALTHVVATLGHRKAALGQVRSVLLQCVAVCCSVW